MDKRLFTQQNLPKHDEKHGQFSFDLSGKARIFLVWFPPEVNLGKRFKYKVFTWKVKLGKGNKEGKATKQRVSY